MRGGRGGRLGYDTAQICLNGHVISGSYHDAPEFRQDFCDKCGAGTTFKCAHCNTEIRGYYASPGVISVATVKAPSYCHGCGKPMPWTAAKLEAAQAMVDELEELTWAQREALKKSIDQIATDSPMTEVAVARIKKTLPMVAKESVGAMRRLIIDVAGKTAAELLKSGG